MNEKIDSQEKVLNLIAQTTAAGHPAPTHREIAAHCGFASSRAAGWHIEALVKAGRLIRQPGKARSLRPAFSSPFGGHRTAEIPIYGNIPAGLADDRRQEAVGCVAVDLDELKLNPTARTFALRVQGDSMTGRGILDGDLVLLEHALEPRSGDIVAALIDGQSTLKTFVVKNRRAFLKAENPKYPDSIPAEELMVQGVFRALIRKAK